MHRFLHCLASIALLAGCADPEGVPDAGNPVDQCTSDANRIALAPFLDDGGMDFDDALDDLLRDCVQTSCVEQLLGDDILALEVCMSACFETTPLGALSMGCQNCFSRASSCGGQHCTVQCLGTDRVLCNDCVDDMCGEQLQACTGLW